LNKLPERELKYTIERRFDANALHLLKALCEPDPKYQTNIISSIYFDSNDHQFAMEKAASDYLKTKLRLRWYTNPQNPEQTSTCHLELKNKIGSTRQKSRWPIECNGSQVEKMVSDGTIGNLIEQQLLKQSHHLSGLNLKPLVLVRYTRHRFIEAFSGTRVALDTDIHAWQPGTESRVVHLDRSVIEAKGTSDVLPQSLQPLSCINIRKDAFSKYYLCFSELFDYQQ
jgi:hypothetical protein